MPPPSAAASASAHTSSAGSWNPFSDSFPLFSCLLLRAQIVALRDHPSDIVLRYGPVQDQGIPVLLVHVIRREHRLIRLPPHIPPLGIALHVDPDMLLPLKNPCKDPVGGPNPHAGPVGIMERIILIGVREGKAVGDRLFSGFHIFIILFQN